MFPYIIAGAIGFGIAKLFEEDKASKYADGGSVLLAPNGQPSNLNPEQYNLVRTPEFKSWFGDWENDPANSSKVVDENGEPLVCYHGTYIKDKQKKGIYTELNTSTYFTDQRLTAEKYPVGDYSFYNSMKELQDDLGEDIVEYINDNFEIDESKGIMYSSDAENVWENFEFNNLHIYECFINIKKPKIYLHFSENEYEFQDLTKDSKIINEFKNSGYDGLIKLYEARWFTEDWYKLNQGIKADYLKEKHFVIFNPNQIKLADGSNTTFDGSNPDIRFDGGGGINESKIIYSHSFLNDKGNEVEQYKLTDGYGGYIRVEHYRDGFVITNIILDERLRRKGLATEFYKKINEQSIKETGKTLQSIKPDSEGIIELSDEGRNLWESFVKNGIARKISNNRYRFN